MTTFCIDKMKNVDIQLSVTQLNRVKNVFEKVDK